MAYIKKSVGAGEKDVKFNPPTPPLVHLTDDANDDGVSKLNMFDRSNPDTSLFGIVDGELVKIAGSELVVYRYMQDDNFDDVYDEHRSKVLYLPPVVIFGHYDPRPIEENLSEFGIELTNDQMFTFNKQTAERQLSRPLIPGDIIKPKFQNAHYEVFEVQEDSFESYGVFHLVCTAKILRDAESLLP